MLKKALITGNSSGLGEGLTQALLANNFHVYGCSRRGCSIAGEVSDIQCDLTNYQQLPDKLSQLLDNVAELELVILNAGILGEMKDMSETSLSELQTLMDVNVWSNKMILDCLLESGIEIKQIVLMSSGAAIMGNRGWAGYALSKATLNMLTRLYAHEFPNTHLSAIAPGLIESKMMDYLCEEADSDRFTAVQRIKQARLEGKILTPVQAAERIIEVLPALQKMESGSFIDIRQILAPDEYENLLQARNKPVIK